MTSELDFISALRQLPLHPGARELEDDCAVMEVGSETLIVTHDMMAEGTHYPEGADMADVAWKLVAVNLSDLAAKGAEPIGVLLGHSLGNDDARLLMGLREVLEAFDVPLLGGDTIATKGTKTFGLTAIGRATHLPVPDRRSAKPGDAVYVTGPLGRAMLGFEGDPACLAAYNRPRPLLSEGQALAPHVSAMMDISDGLLLDSWRMATASDVTIRLESALIPLADTSRPQECMRWGDDYQLLFTVRHDLDLPIPAIRIGKVARRGDASLRLDEEVFSTSEGLGYQHS